MVEAVQVGKLQRYYTLVFAVACSLFALMQFNLKKLYASKIYIYIYIFPQIVTNIP